MGPIVKSHTNGDERAVVDFFQNIPTQSAITLNLLVAKRCKTFESHLTTLNQTFLPFINKCHDYSFIPDYLKEVALRLFQTLNQFYDDVFSNIVIE